MLDAQTLADRYVAAWNERDADRRRKAIAALWAPDGRRAGEARRAREYGVLGRRLPRPREKHVRHDGARFRATRDARRLSDVVTFRWEMLSRDSETVLESGLEFLVVDDEGRILIDHPFAAG